MRRRSRSALLAVALVTSLAACSDAAGPEQPMSGEQLYNRQCARCHGLDGRPTKVSPTARDLTNRSYIDSLGNKGIRMAIMAGRPVGMPVDQQLMPAFGNQFSEPELEVLIGYVRSLSNPELGPQQHTPDVVRERPAE
ncbi:MAG TPA: cytochrome c [Enhygromyxa sp.]|nr:cytochrome c [Enhygromyxa sp.]